MPGLSDRNCPIRGASQRVAKVGSTDSDSLAALRTEAAEGRQVKAAAAKAKIDGQVNDAIRAGKITPARRDHWVTLITADPGMADVLASVPDETAVPRTEIGHSADTDDLTDAATWFR